MGLSKGRTNNPNGRKKGSKNKRTEEKIKKIEYVINLLEESIEIDIKELKPAERAKMWSDLQEYVRPKLQRTSLVGEEDNEILIKIVRE